jgi:hypothetical protein
MDIIAFMACKYTKRPFLRDFQPTTVEELLCSLNEMLHQVHGYTPQISVNDFLDPSGGAPLGEARAVYTLDVVNLVRQSLKKGKRHFASTVQMVPPPAHLVKQLSSKGGQLEPDVTTIIHPGMGSGISSTRGAGHMKSVRFLEIAILPAGLAQESDE